MIDLDQIKADIVNSYCRWHVVIQQNGSLALPTGNYPRNELTVVVKETTYIAQAARIAELEAAVNVALDVLVGTVDGPMTKFQQMIASQSFGEPFDQGCVVEFMDEIQGVFSTLVAALGPKS
jgi:hypothetical protein